MCAIAGILRYAGGPRVARGGLDLETPRLAEAVCRMVEHLRHRGPDGCGVQTLQSPSSDAAIILGNTRLAIIDLSAAGSQPMEDPERGNWVTYNGEIYNYRELQGCLTSLRGRRHSPRDVWRSQTDTEVILKGYARWGQDCVRQFRGMFAFALWDSRRQELFLTRDRLGIKPLYFYAGEAFLVFASEVTALLASGLVPHQLDPVGLWQYLAYQAVPAPRTLIQNVRALNPGCSLTVSIDGALTEQRYWDLLENAASEAKAATWDEARRRVRELLRESIALHLVSDVPVGQFLSGGIDSSAILALMREVDDKPRTFSVGFAEQGYDETRYAREVAAHFRADHTEILVKEPDLLEQVSDALAAMDQPSGDGVNTYIVSRAVRASGMSVALSGLGGDELFAGYSSFQRLQHLVRLGTIWRRTPHIARQLTAGAVRMIGRSSISALKSAAMMESDCDLAALLSITREVLSPAQRRALLQKSWAEAAQADQDPYVHLLRNAFAQEPHADALTCIAYGEARTYMHDVLLHDTDQMSMAHALEVRVPLLDHKLAEYVMGLPASYKRADGTPKPLLVKSLRGALPDSIVRRPKQGFTLPLDYWMRGPLRGFCEQRLGPDGLSGRGIFRPNELQALWASFLQGHKAVSWSRLWVLVALEEWLERRGI
jgi:asparagine synthase (glutamine-hydrolysing)